MLNLNLDKEFINKKIIVTGASRGLGAMLCKALAERGAKLAMLSRSKKEMNKLISNMKNSSNHVSINVNLLKKMFSINKFVFVILFDMDNKTNRLFF